MFHRLQQHGIPKRHGLISEDDTSDSLSRLLFYRKLRRGVMSNNLLGPQLVHVSCSDERLLGRQAHSWKPDKWHLMHVGVVLRRQDNHCQTTFGDRLGKTQCGFTVFLVKQKDATGLGTNFIDMQGTEDRAILLSEDAMWDLQFTGLN